MKVTDLNGFEIEITDLDKAIAQAKLFSEFAHDPPAPCDGLLREYWEDMHKRLIEISSKTVNTVQDERE